MELPEDDDENQGLVLSRSTTVKAAKSKKTSRKRHRRDRDDSEFQKCESKISAKTEADATPAANPLRKPSSGHSRRRKDQRRGRREVRRRRHKRASSRSSVSSSSSSSSSETSSSSSSSSSSVSSSSSKSRKKKGSQKSLSEASRDKAHKYKHSRNSRSRKSHRKHSREERGSRHKSRHSSREPHATNAPKKEHNEDAPCTSLRDPMDSTNSQVMRRKSKQVQKADILKFSTSLQLVVCLEERGGSMCGAFLSDAASSTSARIACTVPGGNNARNFAFDYRCGDYVERFDRQRLHGNGENNLITVYNDCMLLQETFRDPLLSRFAMIVVNKFEERSVYTDILMSLLVKIICQRQDLRVVVFSSSEASAELVRDRFLLATPQCGLLDLRQPRDTWDNRKRRIMYLENPTSNYLQESVDLVAMLHIERPVSAGNILVFLPTNRAVSNFVDLLKRRQGCSTLNLIPWTQGGASQLRVGPAEHGLRHCVVASSVMESSSKFSAALHGVFAVIDSMFTERTVVDSETGVEDRGIVPVSWDEARQRAVFSNELVLRLCTETDAREELSTEAEAEILRSDLSAVCLQLKRLQVRNVVRYSYMTPPPAKAMMRALDCLHALEAMDDEGELTTLGVRIAEFLPLSPMLGRMLVCSLDLGCAEEVLSIAAMLEALEYASLFESATTHFGDVRQQAKSDECMRALGAKEGDLIMYVNIFNAFRDASESQGIGRKTFCNQFGLRLATLKRCNTIRADLARILGRQARELGLQILSCCEDVESLIQCICKSLFLNIARLDKDGQHYVTIHGNVMLEVHPSSLFARHCGIPPPWIVVPRLQRRLRNATRVNPTILTQMAPHAFQPVSESAM